MFNKTVSKRIVSLFNKETKDARKIAEKLNLSRRDVMVFLAINGLRSYSEGSFK
jgi:hypothetical protein